MLKTLFNIFAVCGTAGFAGVMFSIGVTLGGYWKSLPPTEFMDWFAANNQFISRSIPLFFMIAFIGIVGSIYFAWNGPGLKLWIGAGVCIIGVAVLTFGFFVPANTAFANKSIEVAAISAKLNQWITLHYLRIALGMIASILGCLAMKA